MKKAILTSVCILAASLACFSQSLDQEYEYRPYIDGDIARIYVQTFNAHSPQISGGATASMNFFYVFSETFGDEVISDIFEGISCNRHMISFPNNAYLLNGSRASVPEIYYNILRESDKRVYACTDSDEYIPGEHLLMDFNLTAGDTFTVASAVYDTPVNITYNILADELILVKDQVYRRLTIGSEEGQIADYWVEGIGSGNQCFITDMNLPQASNGASFYEPQLVNVYEGGSLIFEYDDFATDNVLSSVISINDATEPSKPEAIYDLSGLPLPSEPKSGIYIRGGEKKLAR